MRAIRSSSCLAERGFTLLEMLVTLVLVGLVTTLLAQALWMSFDVLQRARQQTAELGRDQMQWAWYRAAVQGLQPDHEGGGARFAGTERGFAGLTLAAPDALEATPQPIRVALDYNRESDRTELRASTASRPPLVLAAWSGNGGRFAYLDDQGRAFDTWPPPMGARQPQLPRAIVLEAGLGEQARRSYAVVDGMRDMPVDLLRLLGTGDAPG